MQHKRRFSRAGVLSMAVIGLVIGICVVLMTKDFTPPQQAVEKELDAKTFLGSNQQ